MENSGICHPCHLVHCEGKWSATAGCVFVQLVEGTRGRKTLAARIEQKIKCQMSRLNLRASVGVTPIRQQPSACLVHFQFQHERSTSLDFGKGVVIMMSCKVLPDSWHSSASLCHSSFNFSSILTLTSVSRRLTCASFGPLARCIRQHFVC